VKHHPDHWENIQQFYDLSDDFPKELIFFKASNLVLLSQSAADYIRLGRNNKLKTVNMGVKLFTRNRDEKSECLYRLVQDGVEILQRYLSDTSQRLVGVSRELLAALLEGDHSVTYDVLGEKFNCSQFKLMKKGSAILKYSEDCWVCCWLGVNNLSLMIGKEEINTMRQRL